MAKLESGKQHRKEEKHAQRFNVVPKTAAEKKASPEYVGNHKAETSVTYLHCGTASQETIY